MYETILSPVDYGGLRLKNRILFAPTTFGLSDEETLAQYRALAEGGCAMIIVGDVPVGKSRFEKSLFDAKGFAFYQQLAEIAHAADCTLCAQLHQSDSDLLAMLKYLPALLTKKLTPDQMCIRDRWWPARWPRRRSPGGGRWRWPPWHCR